MSNNLFTNDDARATATDSKPKCANLISNLRRSLVLDQTPDTNILARPSCDYSWSDEMYTWRWWTNFSALVGSCCVYLKIIRAKEAANDDGGVHIRAQIRQWTTITGLRYHGQSPLAQSSVSLCIASVFKLVFLCVFCVFFKTVCICFCFCICISISTRFTIARLRYNGQRPNPLFAANVVFCIGTCICIYVCILHLYICVPPYLLLYLHLYLCFYTGYYCQAAVWWSEAQPFVCCRDFRPLGLAYKLHIEIQDAFGQILMLRGLHMTILPCFCSASFWFLS